MADQDARVLLREMVQPEPGPPLVEAVESAPKIDAPLLATDRFAEAESSTRYRRRVLLVLSAIVLTLTLYWASGYFFAYTDDAYVTSDFVNVAPYISGRIVSINIVDNQTVKKGELLATID